jgi:transposase
MKKTKDKKEYRRAQAILKKAEGKTHKSIAKEHGLSSRSKSSITDEDKEIILSALFNDLHLFGYLRNTWSLRSLAKCLTDELGVPISFKHLQR